MTLDIQSTSSHKNEYHMTNTLAYLVRASFRPNLYKRISGFVLLLISISSVAQNGRPHRIFSIKFTSVSLTLKAST